MYTQCPECATSFRVTADVLRQAAGKVRCGGCGSAFNALLYLSEMRPGKPARPVDEADALPELRPEQDTHDVRDEAPPPRAMSPEQSEALLETLEQLSGEDIRLEDTGLEWRLLSGHDDEAQRTGASVDADVSGDTGEARVDELLEDSPTPIDEYLAASPHDLDAPEVFEGSGDTPVGSVEASEVFDDAAGEMRFDDNTGLPDDFDLDADDLPGSARPALQAEPEPEQPAAVAQPDGLKVDIAFGAPEEWRELLDEVEDDAPPTGDREPEPNAGSLSPADDRQPLDIDTQFDLQAEALGLDIYAGDDGDGGDDSAETIVLADEERSDTGARQAEDYAEPFVDDEVRAAYGADDDSTAEQALHRESAGNDDANIDHIPAADEHGGETIEENLYTAGLDFILDEAEFATADSADETGDERRETRAEGEQAHAGGGADDDDGREESLDESLEKLLEPDFEDIHGDDESMPSAIHDLERELGVEETPDDDDFDLVAGDVDLQPPTILPMSEEEQTINQMIDEDMLRMAVEEDDGLSSSMVLRAEEVESALAEGAEEAAADAAAEESAGVGVETIIMEGEFIRTALEEEALREQGRGEQESGDDQSKENRLVSALRNTMQGRADERSASNETRRRHGLVAGVGVLTLLLLAQLVHQSRAELATIPALNGIIAPIYRTLGAPITPDWDVTGWRFEVTRGSTNRAALAGDLAGDGRAVDLDAPVDDEPEVLTIYSRIGNQADKALPYPLVSVSLTDRFDEIIGSKVMSPNEYLTGDFDPRRFVPPGETFNAVITIESPDAAATGFKLNVCYRESGGRLRCAIEDFL